MIMLMSTKWGLRGPEPTGLFELLKHVSKKKKNSTQIISNGDGGKSTATFIMIISKLRPLFVDPDLRLCSLLLPRPSYLDLILSLLNLTLYLSLQPDTKLEERCFFYENYLAYGTVPTATDSRRRPCLQSDYKNIFFLYISVHRNP